MLSTTYGMKVYPLLSQELRKFMGMIDPRLQELANKIRELVDTSTYSQVEVARLIGVDKSAVSRWMTGERTPTMKNLIDLADTLEVDIRELWAGQEAIPATPEQRMVVELMKDLTPEQQQLLAATAAAFKKGV